MLSLSDLHKTDACVTNCFLKHSASASTLPEFFWLTNFYSHRRKLRGNLYSSFPKAVIAFAVRPLFDVKRNDALKIEPVVLGIPQESSGHTNGYLSSSIKATCGESATRDGETRKEGTLKFTAEIKLLHVQRAR